MIEKNCSMKNDRPPFTMEESSLAASYNQPAWWVSRSGRTLVEDFTVSVSTLLSSSKMHPFERNKTESRQLWNDRKTKVWNDGVLALGVPQIDYILRGGLPCGHLVELVGESGAGKTQWGLCLSIRMLLDTMDASSLHCVVYLYSGGQFPIQRFRKLLANAMSKTSEGAQDSVMQRMLIHHMQDEQELWEAITINLSRLIEEGCNIRLIVLDSVSDVFRPLYSCPGPERQKELASRAKRCLRLASVLKRYAAEQGIFVVVINGVTDAITTTSFEQPHLPALGLTWSTCINTRLQITRLPSLPGCMDAHREVRVLFSSRGPSLRTCFRITSLEGIIDCSCGRK